MALSRSARITLLLVIDILFFFLELVVGEPHLQLLLWSMIEFTDQQVMSSVLLLSSPIASTCSSECQPSSLRHMFCNHAIVSDVMSLVVALYAIKVRARPSYSLLL